MRTGWLLCVALSFFLGREVPALEMQGVLSAGWRHTCALDDGGVRCWGNNDYGQATVPPLKHPTFISTGRLHTCAVDEDGVKCWGARDYDQREVPPLRHPVMVSAGEYHTCALDDDGVKCWGENDHRQTDVPPLKHPRFVSPGGGHTCALDDGGVQCWGANEHGQASVPPLNHPRVVSAGEGHTCALDDEGVKCWGWDGYDQTSVPSLKQPRFVSVGRQYSCAIDDDGVKCWGRNREGELAVPPLKHPRLVSAGAFHACALDDEGVKCWGWNTEGQTNVPTDLDLFGLSHLPDSLKSLSSGLYGYKGRFFSGLSDALSGLPARRFDADDPVMLARLFTLRLVGPVIETTESVTARDRILRRYRDELARAERRAGARELADIPLVSEVFAMSLAAARLSLASSRAFVAGTAERRRLETSQQEVEAIEAELKARGGIGPEPDAALVRRFSALLDDTRPLITALTLDSRTVGFGAVLEKIREYSAGGVAR